MKYCYVQQRLMTLKNRIIDGNERKREGKEGERQEYRNRQYAQTGTMNGIKEDEIMWEEREQKNWHKEDLVEEKYDRLDVSVLRMYKTRDLYCRYNVEDLGSVRQIKKKMSFFDRYGHVYNPQKEGCAMKAFPSGKRNGMGGRGKVERSNWGATNVMYLCVHSPTTSSHS